MPDLRRFARSLVIDARDQNQVADDLVQRTMARALRDERLRRGAPVRVTLYSLLTGLNRRRLRGAGEARADDSAPADVAARQPELVWQTRIEQAIARLPVELRETLLLVVLEKMSYADTAEIIEAPMATMLARLTRARDDLRVSFNGAASAAPPMETPAGDFQGRPSPAREKNGRAHLRLVK